MSEQLDRAEFRRGMIDDYLKSRELQFLRYNDGDFAVRFRWNKRTVDFAIGTDDTGSILWFEATAATAFSVDQVPFLLLVANEFMQSHRWPRLTVRVEGDEAFVVCDGHLAMFDSLEDFEVARFLDGGVGATQQFWSEFALPDGSSMEAEIISLLGEDQGGAA
jgi:hypothetical protein